MHGVLSIARAQWRERRLSLIALTLVAGVVGAVVMGSVAGARRTHTAYDRLLTAMQIDDVRVSSFDKRVADRAATLPSVERAWKTQVAIGQIEARELLYLAITAGPPPPPGLFTPIMMRGRPADPTRADEVIVFEKFATESGFDLGDRIAMKLLSSEQFFQFDTGIGEPKGPRIELRITGVARSVGDDRGFLNVLGTPALHEVLTTADPGGGGLVLARLRAGIAGLPRFKKELADATASVRPPDAGREFSPYELAIPAEGRAAVAASSNVLVAGLLATAVVALLAGAAVIAQALARAHAAGADDQRIEAALGATRAQRAVGRALPSLGAGLIAAACAVGLAYLSSAWTPASVLARFEPEPGRRADPWVLGIGTTALIVLLFVADGVAAARAGRSSTRGLLARPSRFAEAAAAAGARPPVVVGLRNALDRVGRDGRVPSRSALTGAVLGIAGVAAVAVFSASLMRLVTTPARFGWQGDILIADLKDQDRAALTDDRRVADLSVVDVGSARAADGSTITVAAATDVRGSIGWTMLRGRAPASPNEVVLGTRVAKRLGVDIGDTVRFVDPRDVPTHSALVVGVGIAPPLTSEPLGGHALIHPRAFATVSNTESFRAGYLRVAEGVDTAAVARELSERMEVTGVTKPAEVANLENLGRLPGLLGLLLAIVGVAAVSNALLIGSRRRRKDVGILKTIGFERGDVRRTVMVTAGTMLVVGIAIGTPVGLLVGSLTWRSVAELSHLAGDSTIPGVPLAGAIAVVSAVVLAIATVPAVGSGRLAPADALRAE